MTLRAQANEVKRQKAQVERELNQLDSRHGQLLAQLRRDDPHAAKGVEWLQDNQSRFKKAVFGPAMLCCSIKDDRYSDLVQACLRRDDLTCFTVQTDEDYDLLNHEFYDKLDLNVSIRTVRSSRNEFPPPLDSGTARDYGFDGFAIDYLDGPDPVLAMLCAHSLLHASGVTLRETSDEQYRRISTDDRIGSWVSGAQSYRIIRRRELGPDAVSTTTRKVFPGPFWK